MWKVNAEQRDLIQFKFERTELYLVIAKSHLHEKAKHSRLFWLGAKYYMANPNATVLISPSISKEKYGYCEPPFYQGFIYTRLYVEYLNEKSSH